MSKVKRVRCKGLCNKVKDQTTKDFYRAPDTLSGLTGVCKLCLKKRNKERRDSIRIRDPKQYKPLWNGEDGIFC